MTFIHWFPGHMTKSLRMMEAEISAVDSVVYVLDARAPLSSINPAFEKVIKDKPRLYILNKADLIDKRDAEDWKRYFEEKGFAVLLANSVSKKDAKKISEKLLDLNAAKIERFRLKGVKKTLRAMVIGIPNSGKSTLINSLVPKKKAVTGNRPGVTRGKQWVSVAPYIDLLDSPGVLYPDFTDQKKAMRLAVIGSVRDEVVDETELSVELLNYLSSVAPDAIQSRYGAKSDLPPKDILVAIATKRGALIAGGIPDVEKAAKLLLTDYRKGYLGKIALEKVCDRSEGENRSND